MHTDGSASTIDQNEVELFGSLAETWWDADGPMKPLHQLNPTRIRYIRDRILQHHGLAADGSTSALTGIDILDIGCGGGLVCEPLARLGANVTGADAAAENIRVASAHAEAGGLNISYRNMPAEDLKAEGASFDVVLALEIVEHVADVDLFVQSIAGLLRPGGLLIMSTLNRTFKAWAMAIVGAEYIMGWLPKGTHHHDKFLRPAELARHVRNAGLMLDDVCGMAYHPLGDGWVLAPRDTDVNYFLSATRPG